MKQGYYPQQLTLFSEDFPASDDSHFQWLDGKEGKKINDISGRTLRNWSPTLGRITAYLKMCLELCELPLTIFVRTWKISATQSGLSSRSGGYGIFQLRLSERRTDAQECFLWHTPNVPNGGRVNPKEMTPTGKMPGGVKRQVGLEHQVRMVEDNLWPTPTVHGNYTRCTSAGNRAGASKNSGNGLETMVKMYPTPTSRDYKDGTAKSCENVPVNGLLGRFVHIPAMQVQVPASPLPRCTRTGREDGRVRAVVGGSLNPAWVEWLMGFPPYWTELCGSVSPTSPGSHRESPIVSHD